MKYIILLAIATGLIILYSTNFIETKTEAWEEYKPIVSHERFMEYLERQYGEIQ